MEAMARDLWTDERLDDLNVRVDRGFDVVQREFIALRTETRAEFAAVRSEMKIEFASARGEIATARNELSSQIATSQRLLLQLFIPQTIAMTLGFAGLILTRT